MTTVGRAIVKIIIRSTVEVRVSASGEEYRVYWTKPYEIGGRHFAWKGDPRRGESRAKGAGAK
jgi:hypothetical protein